MERLHLNRLGPPGAATRTRYVPLPSTVHVHEWHRTERAVHGAILKFWGCVAKGCPSPMRAYDMEVADPSRFQGRSEFDALPRKSS